MTSRAWYRFFSLALVCGAVAGACGGDDGDSDGAGAAGGAGGIGGTDGAGGDTGAGEVIQCGNIECAPLALPLEDMPPVPACCPEGSDVAVCGLDSESLGSLGVTFEEACQPLAQPGEEDPDCLDSPLVQVPDTAFSVTFDGCCRPETNTCGYLVDDALGGLIPIGLGCVDSAPFLEEGEAPTSCDGTGSGGAGEEPGAGGQPAASDGGAGGA